MTSKVYGVCRNKMKTTQTKTWVGDNTLDPGSNSVIKVIKVMKVIKVIKRLGQHKGDIQNQRLNKAVAKHFHDTRSTVADLVFVPFKLVRSEDRLILRLFENKCINQFNLIEAGINRILT